jgi:hypothetical protein
MLVRPRRGGECIVGPKAAHEIGSHGGRHRYFNALTAAQAREELEFARDLHRAHNLPFESFVFPRNSVGQLEILRGAGLRTYRGPDLGWLMTAGNVGRIAGRIMNLADKSLPIPPTLAFARQGDAGLIDIPGSMLLLGRNGVRRFVLSTVTRAKLAMDLARARWSNG